MNATLCITVVDTPVFRKVVLPLGSLLLLVLMLVIEIVKSSSSSQYGDFLCV